MFIRYHFFLLFEYLSTPPWSRFLVLPLSQSVNSWLGSNFHPPSADMLLDRILYVGYSRSQFLVALWNDLGWSQALADSDSLSVGFFAFTILGGNFTSFPCGSKKVYWNIRPLKCFFPSISWITTIAWLACFLGIMSSPHLPNNEMTQVMVRTTPIDDCQGPQRWKDGQYTTHLFGSLCRGFILFLLVSSIIVILTVLFVFHMDLHIELFFTNVSGVEMVMV